MRRRLLRSLAIVGCVAWSARTLGCDPSAASTKSTFVDTDGDGLSDTDEITIYGTSPVLADTDGDGISDYDEVITRGFNPESQPLLYNPRVADLPEMVVQLAGPPMLSLNLITTEGETWTWDTSRTLEDSVSWTLGTSEDVTFSNTLGGSDTVTKQVAAQFSDGSLSLGEAADAGADAGTDTQRARRRQRGPQQPANPVFPLVPQRPIQFDSGGPNTVTLTSSVAATVDWSNTNSLTLSFSADQTREIRQAVTFAQGYALNHQISASGADLGVLVYVFNTGTLPFVVTNFLVSTSFIGPGGVEIPVANLPINSNLTTYVNFSVAPGGYQGPFNCERLTLTLEQFAMLGDLSGLKVNVGTYDLADANFKPYVFHVPEIVARTATVDIDYGGMRPHERYYVATNLDPAHPGVTLDRALREILRIPFDNVPERGLTSLRNVATVDPGRWTVEMRHNEGGEPVTTAYTAPYDVRDILLRAGDVVHLSWSAP